MSDEIEGAYFFPLEWDYPDDLQTHFVSNILVQHQEDYFVISFFEIWPPPILGETDEDRQKAIKALGTIKAKCVARLVVSPSTMDKVINTLSTNYANWMNRKEGLEGEA